MAASSNRPDWAALLELYEQGAGDIEVARSLKITIKRFYQLIEEVPAFAEFVEQGNTLAQAWWIEKGRTSLWDKTFNVALYNFNMKNRYGWADKIDTSDKTDTENVNLDQAKAQLALALKNLSKKHPELVSGANLNTNSNS